MVNICVCAGCSNSCLTGHRVHFFPKTDRPAFRSWVRFVHVKRADFTASSVHANSVICGAHFREEDYVQGDVMEHKMGFRGVERVRLIPDAVPSIQTPGNIITGTRSSAVVHKLGLSRTLRQIQSHCATPGVTEEPMEAAEEEDAGEGCSAEHYLPPSEHPPTEPHRKPAHKGTQCYRKPPHRSSGIQVVPKMLSLGTQTVCKMVSVETQTELSSFVESPLCSPMQSQCTISQSASEQSAPKKDDDDWLPESEELFSESSDDSPHLEPPSAAFNIDKYVVCHNQLMMLFANCPGCSEATQPSILRQEGTFVKIEQVCAACGFQRHWQNQSILHRNMPECNLQLSGAIHFSGCMPQQTFRMLQLFGLQCTSPNTYFRHQRNYTIPTVIQAWQSQQASILGDLKQMEEGLILSGDCRSDSPGHCAKYGTYSLIEDRLNKVVDLQLVQSNEVQNSNWCELEGLQRSIRFLKAQDLKVAVIVTDRNRQVAKWVGDNMCKKDGTQHFFDVWHIAKSVGKKLEALSKERDCDVVKLWKPSLVNHLYWTAASTLSGNPDMMEAKWRSAVNHVQDIHEHDSPAFPVCLHDPLEGEDRDKAWLEPGSTAAVKLEALFTKTLFIKDVRQLSPQHQTYSLESFHSLIIRFAPKHTGFSFLGMRSRLLLAAMHYNHNGNRAVATTRAGAERHAVAYPRFRKGQPVVHPIKEKPSYDYALDLMVSLKTDYARSPSDLRAIGADLAASAPPPVAKTFQQVEKSVAVSQYQERKRYYSAGHQDHQPNPQR